MNELKATPGDWKSHGNDSDWWLGTEECGPIITASYMGCVEVQNPADMALIVNSRKLYEMLDKIVNSGQWSNSALEFDEGGGEDLEAEALAVLARARGAR